MQWCSGRGWHLRVLVHDPHAGVMRGCSNGCLYTGRCSNSVLLMKEFSDKSTQAGVLM